MEKSFISNVLIRTANRYKLNLFLEVNQLLKKNKTWIVLFIIIILFIAGILDLKYQGLFFQLLPESIQTKITGA